MHHYELFAVLLVTVVILKVHNVTRIASSSYRIKNTKRMVIVQSIEITPLVVSNKKHSFTVDDWWQECTYGINMCKQCLGFDELVFDSVGKFWGSFCAYAYDANEWHRHTWNEMNVGDNLFYSWTKMVVTLSLWKVIQC